MYLTLVSMWNQFLDALANFSDGIEVNLKLCKVELEARWRSLKTPLENIEVELRCQVLYNPLSVPAECIEIIESLQTRTDTVSILIFNILLTASVFVNCCLHPS